MLHQRSFTRRRTSGMETGIETIAATSFTHLQECLFEEAWKPGLRRFRSDLAFRGQGDAAQPLTTTLQRLGGQSRTVEHHLLRNFRKYAHQHSVSLDSEWGWLALGQHHGLPTRLLDWTYSPLVAMHFATDELRYYDRDAVIWCVDYVKLHQRAPGKLKRVLTGEGSNVFTVEMLTHVAASLKSFDALAKTPFALLFEPPSMDQRIVTQYALFSLMSGPTLQMDSWLAKQPDLVRRIVIPAELKWEIRDKLDQANVTERVLLPGFDGLSMWLTRHYTSRAYLEAQAGNASPGARANPIPEETDRRARMRARPGKAA
jgi:hypothetical protein